MDSADWISADERLPHWTEWVAVKSDKGEYGEGFFHGPFWSLESRWKLDGTVTHWKPKPAGPDFGGPCDEDQIPA